MAKPSVDSEYPLETLLELAEEILEDMKGDGPDRSREYDPGFVSSYYVYPKADALSYVCSVSQLCSGGSSSYA